MTILFSSNQWDGRGAVIVVSPAILDQPGPQPNSRTAFIWVFFFKLLEDSIYLIFNALFLFSSRLHLFSLSGTVLQGKRANFLIFVTLK